MITWIVTSSILIIIVLILRAIVRKKISRRMQYAMWGLVLIKLLMPFSILDSHMSIMNIVPVNTATQLKGSVLPAQTQGTDEAISVQQKESKQGVIAEDNSKGATKPSRESEIVNNDKMAITVILQLVWIIGGVLFGIWFISTNIRFFIKLRKERIHYERSGVKLPIYLSENVISPCLYGVVHPSIYLTYKAVEEGVCTEHVIVHELCHYHHGDQIWSLMRGLCLTIWWWNPLVWIAAIISKKDAEMACDEAAIKKLGEAERLGYGRTLVTMIAVKKKKNILYTATTMTSDKKEIKDRLTMIIKNPKVVRPVVVGVTLIILLIAECTFTGAYNNIGSQGSRANRNSDNQIPSNNTDLEDASQSEETAATPVEIPQSDTIELQAMHTKDMYEGGKLFVDVDKKFVESFQNKVAALTIPDARKGERAANILDPGWDKGLVFLNSLPEKNIYLYGYNDTEHLGQGLILDMGEEQHIYSFPYRYMTNTTIAPSLSASNDGSKLFLFCYTGSGTGVSISELYVFQVSNNEVEPYYVDISELIELLTNKLSMKFNTKNKIMTIYSEGKQIASDTIISTDNNTPEGFYCGDHIRYIMAGDIVKVICEPTIHRQNEVGIPSYLENVSLEADINLKYDSNGKIIGFDIGELAAVKNQSD